MDRREFPGKRRLALKIQYDGTAFHGWQIQENDYTVQQELERALKVLTGEKRSITASGRTDAGVHALGQIAHFDSDSNLSLQRFCIGLNGIMAKDVSVINAYEVDSEFHARFSATQRQYEYRIYNHQARSPFNINRQLWIREPLDTNELQEFFNHLLGEHDFASFCKKISCEYGTVRTIHSISVHRHENDIRVVITGNAFLHNMIRIIIGTVIQMYVDNADPRGLLDILNRKDREASGKTASPVGLYLKKVSYNPSLNSLPSAYSEALLID